VPDNLDLVVDGVVVEPGANQVIIPNKTFQYIGPADSSDFQSVRGYRMQVYQQSNDDFVQIDLRPPDLGDLSQAEGLAVVEEYYAADPDVEVYKDVYLTDDTSGLTIEQNMSYSNFLSTGATRILQELYSPEMPVGSYWVVFTEEILCVSQAQKPKSWLARAIDRLIPTAHAQFGDSCSPGYIPKRFVLELDITQASDEPAGASSVLFLPGIQASRLYKVDDQGREEIIWEPNSLLFGQDVRDLAMTQTGVSVNDVYTRDVVDELPITGQNIYKGLLEFLDTRKAVGDISNWEAFPYDWRYSVAEVAKTGTLHDDQRVSLIAAVERLAAENNSQVTLIGHSNGGLLAKALMIELDAIGKADLVDKVILIASPQTGTPQAIGTILHGLEQNTPIGLIMNRPTGRLVGKNIPGLYGLLPTQAYLRSQLDPVISFEPGEATDSLIAAYGNDIASWSELASFLEAEEGRSDTAFFNLDAPSVVNPVLLDELDPYRNQLDVWRAPDGVEVIEIVGTGLITLQAIEYRSLVNRSCSFGGLCIELPDKLQATGRFDMYGDGTVTVDSADSYRGDKQTYYINLRKYNDDKFIVFDRQHANIGEVEELEILLAALLDGRSTENIDFISTEEPDFTGVSYIVLSTHSPVTLKVNDNAGNETSVDKTGEIIVTEIPGSQTFTLGSSTYVFIPEETDFDATIEGYQTGSYTLRIEQITDGRSATLLSEFQGAPVTPQMIATFSRNQAELTNIETDFNNDGIIDEIRTPTGELLLDGFAVPSAVEDTVVLEPSQSSVTRVGDRSPVPIVLGASTTNSGTMISADMVQLQKMIFDIESLLQDHELNSPQLAVLTDVLSKSLQVLSFSSSLTN
jgi:pimeloyl-ACP methyl ester carboxylesterase